MKRSFCPAGLLALGLTAISLPAPAADKDPKAACVDAASTGQSLRDAHKLIEAREQFRICARAECPAVVQGDCAGWLDAAERSLPTVVLSAKNASGGDLVDVKVSVDGQPLVARLDGVAVAMNPGAHALHFEGAGGATLDQTVLVREGEKDRVVSVVVGGGATPATPATAAPPPPAPPTSSSAAAAPLQTPAEDHGGSSPWRTVGWVGGGVGLLGIAVGSAFAIDALSKKSDAQCDAQGFCNAAPLGDARSAANAATVGFVAGGVLLAGSVAVVLFAPKSGSSGALQVRLTPVVATNGAGFAASGAW